MADEVDVDKLEVADELIAERRAEEPGQTPENMTPWMRPITAFIDVMNLWAGRITCLMLVPIIYVMVHEVVARKIFLAPTDWSFEASRMLGGAMFMAGAGYALMRGVHIRADFLYRGWQRDTQATVDALLYLAFYFPAMLFFFWVSLDYTWDAWASWERSMDTATMAPLAPARTAMPLGALFLLLQGVAELFRAFTDMGKKRERVFLRLMPVYLIALAAIFTTAFYPNLFPLGDWWAALVGTTGISSISPEAIGLIMIAVMLFAIFVGFPISFTLIFLAFVFGAWGFGGRLAFYLQTLQFNSVMLDEQLVAVPLFVFMGIMMEQAGLMERLFTSVQLMLSRTRGALYIAVLFVSTIFAAATGIVGASVTILGIMAAKTMNKSGYDVRVAAGTITAGGTLGILIPPSIMLVVMGPVLEVPVTDLFAAAIVPGIMLASLYMIYAIGRCMINPELGPILPPEEQPTTSPYYFLEVVTVMGSLIMLCYLGGKALLGGFGLFFGDALVAALIWVGLMYVAFNWTRANKPGGFFYSDLWYEFFMGLVPPTVLVAFALVRFCSAGQRRPKPQPAEHSGAIVLSLAYRKLTLPGFYDALIKTLEISVLIMFLVAASNFFGAVFSRLGNTIDANRTAAVLGDVGDHGADRGHGADLPARLAARVGADRADHRAHSHPAFDRAGRQSALVRHSCRRQSADRLAQSAGGPVSLLPQGCRA